MKTIKTATTNLPNLAADYAVGDTVNVGWTAWDGRGGYDRHTQKATVVKVNKVTLDLEYKDGTVMRWHYFNDWRIAVKKARKAKQG